MAGPAISVDELKRVCDSAEPTAGINVLNLRLRTLMPELECEHVLNRGNWHRLGGVVDREYRPVAENLEQWAEEQMEDDLEGLLARYMDEGYFVTRYAGTTHYFTIPTGDGASDFMQLEVEELQEVLDRAMVDRDWFPDTLDEFVDPLDYPRLEPEPVGKPFYRFRRLTEIGKLLNESPRENQALYNLRRFFEDWSESSASESGHFCRYWVLALREYMDSEGECRMSGKPITVYAGDLPILPASGALNGAELANAIHSYDHDFGYPFAWYFMLLTSKASNYELADAVLQDQVGAYDYLPPRDLKVLRSWEERPYGV
ncbi:MAG: hypothetical protein ABW090_05450 [Sedimenticola sp.]